MNPAPEQNSTQRIGKGMIFAAWILVLVLLSLFFQRWLDHQENPNQQYYSATNKSGMREILLQRNRYGHYVASGAINNQPVVFLLDTGATEVSIPGKVAKQLKLKPAANFHVNTANGVVEVYATKIHTLQMGGIELHNVRAHINPHMEDNEILLGMSALKQLEWAQRDDTLTLRQYPEHYERK